MKYLLSTNNITDKIEYYILDLFKLYLQIYPEDIPGSGIGFNFVLTDVKKTELPNEVKSRIERLISYLNGRFSGVSLSLESIEILDEERAKITINVNNVQENITINLFGD